jgi:hypothetical protein
MDVKKAVKDGVLDIDEVIESAHEGDGTGYCLACGESRECCEPDARNYECDSCGKRQVFGAEEIILGYVP